MIDLATLHTLLQEAVPQATIISVSIPDKDDKSSWIVQYEPVNDVNQAAIDAAIQEYDITQPHPLEAHHRRFIDIREVSQLIGILNTGKPDDIKAWIEDRGSWQDTVALVLSAMAVMSPINAYKFIDPAAMMAAVKNRTPNPEPRVPIK